MQDITSWWDGKIVITLDRDEQKTLDAYADMIDKTPLQALKLIIEAEIRAKQLLIK